MAHSASWSLVPDAGHGPHGVGLIVDRAVLDGPWPLVDAALRVRSARPADSKGGGAVIGLRPFIVCDYARSFFILLAAFLWTVLSSRTETRLSNVMFPAVRPAPIGSKK